MTDEDDEDDKAAMEAIKRASNLDDDESLDSEEGEEE